MRRQRVLTGACALALAAGLVAARDVQAGAAYSSSVVATTASSNFDITKIGKISIKPATKAGQGGITLALKLGSISCTAVDASPPGQCGGDPTTIVNHVMSLGVSYAGADFADVVGLRYSITGGKPAFQATGKNTINGTAFGALASFVFNQPIGFGVIKLREPGSNPTACNSVPLTTGNACTDGLAYGIAGIVAGSDPGVSCSSNANCANTGICTSGTCGPEPCTTDAQCDQDGTGNGGTGQCGSNMQCCDPGLDPTCAGQVP